LGRWRALPQLGPPRLGESLFFVSKVPFFAIFLSSNFFWKAPFSPFFANNKAPFIRRISLREKKCHFREKNREKQARPNSQPKTGPFFAAFRTAKSRIFRHFSLREKSAIFAAFRSAKKKCHFSRKISRKKRLDPSHAAFNDQIFAGSPS
jgi:hypothetical protein